MTKYAKAANGLCVRFSLWMKGIALDSQSGQPLNGLISTTAENGRIITMISREEARVILKEMHDYMHEGYMTNLVHGGKQDVTMEGDIEALSVAIEALSHERPKGRWKRCKYSHKLGECSLCGEIVEIRSKYCPNCGAEMRGERE